MVSLLEPHFDDEKWREVIPLTAVLAGRKAEQVVARLTDCVMELANQPTERQRVVLDHTFGLFPSYLALGHCLADEAQARPETIAAGMRVLIAASMVYLESAPFFGQLLNSKYGQILRDEATAMFFMDGGSRANAGTVLSEPAQRETRHDLKSARQQVLVSLRSTSAVTR